MSKSRQLAAIMFTDIVGFTALMGSDEQKTLEILEMNRQIHKPIITAYNGRWIKELGDGVMASFTNISDAINAAIKIMEACNAANAYQLCIGIHSAEVVFEHDDIFGDGVNIAARIQSAAPAGCILISETVQNSIANKIGIRTNFYKEEKLKNVIQPIRLHQVLIEGSEIAVAEQSAYDNKSIAVLPFVNMSSDPEQEYFSDGISEEVINMLAQVPKLKVMGRTSSFAFKGKNMDLKLIGEQLNVGYLLEGSVRKSGNKLRITAQLINIADGTQMFSEQFDRELKDIFDIQDEISANILETIKIKLLGEAKEAVLKKYTDNIEAYQLYLKGKFYYNKYNKEAFLKAIDYFNEAVAIDPNYAIAYTGISYSYYTLSYWLWLPTNQSLPFAIKAAEKSIQLDDQIAETHLAIGRLKMLYEWNVRDALVAYKKAMAINPNNPEIYHQLVLVSLIHSNFEDAIKYAEEARRLDPFSIMNLWFTAIPYMYLDSDKAIAVCQEMIDLDPDFFGGHLWLGEVYMQQLGQYEDAIIEYKLAVGLENGPNSLSALGVCYARLEDYDKAMGIIEELKKIEGIEHSGNFYIGWVYEALGQWDSAFEYFYKAIKNREGMVLWIKFNVSPEFLEDPRFKEFEEKMNIVY